MRQYLSSKIPVREGDSVLDLCTGTGALLLYLQQRVEEKGLVVSVHFSWGMLEVCNTKNRRFSNIQVLESDVAYLPFKDNSFDAVTRSYAFYELKGRTQEQVLEETVQVLKSG